MMLYGVGIGFGVVIELFLLFLLVMFIGVIFVCFEEFLDLCSYGVLDVLCYVMGFGGILDSVLIGLM